MNVTDIIAPNVRRVRAYFAPVNRTAQAPTLFDAAAAGRFALDTPPAPWVDLGFVRGFKRRSTTSVVALESGAPAAARSQVRTQIGAELSLRFEAWGKLQLALTAGSQQMNLLADAGSAVSLSSGATATSLPLSNAPAGSFAVGSIVAVDLDNDGATGFLGSGVSGAYLRATVNDIDYIRRITLNVARVAGNSNGVLTLASPLIAGVPTAAMKVSEVVGFCDREGSSFFAEWSALFIAEGQQGERILWHYPRLQSMGGIAEDVSDAAGGLESVGLLGSFRALPVIDPVDGESVVCYRSYLPCLA